jgi:hypothetical protein
MIVRPTKDYRYYELLYESQEEAVAVKDYLDRGVAGTAYFQHEQETFTK